MISLFIDANIYLRFYAYTDDDLLELEKLDALSDAGELRIFKNAQLEDEVARNRENKIQASLDIFRKSGPNVQVPRFARHFPEAQQLLDVAKSLQKLKSELSQKITEEIASGELRADKLIKQILAKAEEIPITLKVLEAARWRQMRGNPPGKRVSLGDQLHWEALLSGVPNNETIYIVSMDGDFVSTLIPGQPNPRLAAEWEKEKAGQLHVYESLGAFARAHFSSISLPADVTKSSAISRLASSKSFESTHKQIEKLEGVFDEITSEEAQIIFQAIIDNNQIRWIAEDEDVKEFYEKLYMKHWTSLPPDLFGQLDEVANYFMPF